MCIYRRTFAVLAALAAMRVSTAAEQSVATPDERVVYGKHEAVKLDQASVRVDVDRHPSQGSKRPAPRALGGRVARDRIPRARCSEPRCSTHVFARLLYKGFTRCGAPSC